MLACGFQSLALAQAPAEQQPPPTPTREQPAQVAEQQLVPQAPEQDHVLQAPTEQSILSPAQVPTQAVIASFPCTKAVDTG